MAEKKTTAAKTPDPVDPNEEAPNLFESHPDYKKYEERVEEDAKGKNILGDERVDTDDK